MIKFSFEGTREDLIVVLKGLTARAAPASAPTMEELHVDPVYGGVPGPSAPGSMGESNPAPVDWPSQDPAMAEGFDFGSLPCKPEAWEVFEDFVTAWAVNFDATGAEQPDRLALLKALGASRWVMYALRWLAHYGSLQGAIFAALQDGPLEGEDLLDLVDRLSANITQVAHAAFPDIAGFHDYGTKWKRALTRESEEEQAS
ncbi:hypothetical protein CMI37_16560 [Candidatus Pacearchaeota archaeon]|nr:hypothetical protein [Candidatus Pacearchaeota archaeon]|tara:strand:- start:2604 stop:3206 length:603 start_codon:yes stop_codon:yes gene_type:complete